MVDDYALTTEDLEKLLLPRRIETIDHVLQQRTDGVTIVLDSVHNTHNISAIIRSAEAFGLCSAYLVGTQFEERAGISQGAEQWIDLRSFDTPDAALDDLQRRGYTVVVTAPANQQVGEAVSVPVYELPFGERLAFVFGNEKVGVSPQMRQAAMFAAHVPMFGFTESFNVSVACAICLFCSTVQVVAAERPRARLSDEEHARLRLDWLKKSVANSELILSELAKRRSS